MMMSQREGELRRSRHDRISEGIFELNKLYRCGVNVHDMHPLGAEGVEEVLKKLQNGYCVGVILKSEGIQRELRRRNVYRAKVFPSTPGEIVSVRLGKRRAVPAKYIGRSRNQACVEYVVYSGGQHGYE